MPLDLDAGARWHRHRHARSGLVPQPADLGSRASHSFATRKSRLRGARSAKLAGDVTVTKADPEFERGGGGGRPFTVPPYAATWVALVFRLLLLAVAIPDRAGPMPALV